MRIIGAYDDFRSQMRTHVLNLISKYQALDLIYSAVETPNGDDERWDIIFDDDQAIKIEITKTA